MASPPMSRKASWAAGLEHVEKGLAPTELLHLLDDRVRLINSLEERVKSIEGKLVENDDQHGKLFDDQLSMQSRMEDVGVESSSVASAHRAFEERLEKLERGPSASSPVLQAMERRLAALESWQRESAGRTTLTESSVKEMHVHRRHTSGSLAESAHHLANTELLHMLDDRVRLIGLLDVRVKKAEQLLEENDAQHSRLYDDQVAIAARTEAFEQEAASLAARVEALESRPQHAGAPPGASFETRLEAVELRLEAASHGGVSDAPGGKPAVAKLNTNSPLAESAHHLPNTELLHMLDDRVRLIGLLDDRVKKVEASLQEKDTQHNKFYDDQVAAAARAEAFEQEARSLASRDEELQKRVEALERGRPPSGKEGQARRQEAPGPDPRLVFEQTVVALEERLHTRLEVLGREARERLEREAASSEVQLKAKLEASLESKLREELGAAIARRQVTFESSEIHVEHLRVAERRIEEDVRAAGRRTDERLKAFEHRLQECDMKHNQLAHDLAQEHGKREAQYALLDQRVGAMADARGEGLVCRADIAAMSARMAQEMAAVHGCSGRLDRVERTCKEVASSIVSSMRRLDDIAGGLSQLEGSVALALRGPTPAKDAPKDAPAEFPDLRPLRAAIQQMRDKPGFDEEVARAMDASIGRAEQNFASVRALGPEASTGQQPRTSKCAPEVQQHGGSHFCSTRDAATGADPPVFRPDLAVKDVWRQVECRVASAEAYMRTTEEGLDREFKRHVAELSERVGRLEAASGSRQSMASPKLIAGGTSLSASPVTPHVAIAAAPTVALSPLTPAPPHAALHAGPLAAPLAAPCAAASAEPVANLESRLAFAG